MRQGARPGRSRSFQLSQAGCRLERIPSQVRGAAYTGERPPAEVWSACVGSKGEYSSASPHPNFRPCSIHRQIDNAERILRKKRGLVIDSRLHYRRLRVPGCSRGRRPHRASGQAAPPRPSREHRPIASAFRREVVRAVADGVRRLTGIRGQRHEGEGLRQRRAGGRRPDRAITGQGRISGCFETVRGELL